MVITPVLTPGYSPLWILTPGIHTLLGTHQLNTDPLYVPTSLGTPPRDTHPAPVGRHTLN